MDRQAHWNAAYAEKSETGVSWFQEVPAQSLASIADANPQGSVIDVGGGASRLVDTLLDARRGDLTVLDISAVALDSAKVRLGAHAASVRWICADITQWKPDRQWDIWHDRAVFHFLTEEPAQDAYIAALTAATRPGSAAIIATFAPSGPQQCSGLPVRRYSPADLAQRLGQAFALYDGAAENHVTPWGAVQDFTYAAFRRL